MEFEHTVVMKFEVTKIFDGDNKNDVSGRFAKVMKKCIERKFDIDDVKILECQDFIREKKESERGQTETGNWIRFDPDDNLTWPEMNVTVPEMEEEYRESKRFLACFSTDDDDYVICTGVLWTCTNGVLCFNEVTGQNCPVDSIIAWQPLPEPYRVELFHMEQKEEK